MGVRVLGRPALLGPDGPVEIRGARQTALLAILAANRGRPVPGDLIADELWRGAPVSRSSLRVTITRLRERFVAVTGRDPITSTPAGYVLDLPDDESDDGCFEQILRDVRDRRDVEDGQRWLSDLAAGLAMWTGGAFEGVDDLSSVMPARARLTRLRAEADELLASGLIEAGRNAEALSVIDRMRQVNPYSETAWGLAALAHYGNGDQRQALRSLTEFHRVLSDEVGLVPGSELAALERAILDLRPFRSLEFHLVRADHSEANNPRPSPRAANPGADTPFDTSPMVGRSDELAAAMRLGTTAPPSAVIIEAAAGMGKTKLLATATDAMSGAAIVVTAACPRDGTLGMQVIRAILGGVAEHTADDGPAPVDELVARLLGTSHAGALPASSPAGEEEIALDAEMLLRSIEAPLVLVIDDAQWMTESASRLLTYLVDAVHRVNWLVALRPGQRQDPCTRFLAALSRRPCDWRQLAPLNEDEVADLVRIHTTAAAPIAWLDAVVDRAGGNPLLAIELSRYLDSGGSPGGTPRTLEAVLSAEMAALPDQSRQLAEIVAIGESPLPTRALLEAAEIDRTRADEVINELVSSGLISVDDDSATLRPSHDLIRTALVDGLGDHRRQAGHLRIARALEQLGSRYRDDRLSHLLAAGTLGSAAELDEAAVVVLRHLHDQAAMADLADVGERYLASPLTDKLTRDGLEARLLIAAGRIAVGKLFEGRGLLTAIRPTIDALADPALSADALLVRSPFTLPPDDPEVAALVEEGERVLNRLPTEDRLRRGRLAAWLGSRYATMGRTRDAEAMLRLTDLAMPIDAPDQAWAASVSLAYQVACAVDRDPHETTAVRDRVALLAGREGDPILVGLLRLLEFDHSMRHGTTAHYAAALDAAGGHTFSRGPVEFEWWLAACRAGLHLFRGDIAPAAESQQQAMAIGLAAGLGSALSVGLLHQFLVEWEQGTLATYHSLLRVQSTAPPPAQLAATGLICWAAGDGDGATRAADELTNGPTSMATYGMSEWPVVASLGSELAFLLRHGPLAESILEHLPPHSGTGLSASGFAYMGSADRAIGLCAAALGDTQLAIRHLTRAVEADDAKGAPTWARRSAEALATLRS